MSTLWQLPGVRPCLPHAAARVAVVGCSPSRSPGSAPHACSSRRASCHLRPRTWARATVTWQSAGAAMALAAVGMPCATVAATCFSAAVRGGTWRRRPAAAASCFSEVESRGPTHRFETVLIGSQRYRYLPVPHTPAAHLSAPACADWRSACEQPPGQLAAARAHATTFPRCVSRSSIAHYTVRLLFCCGEQSPHLNLQHGEAQGA
jgi:hypothetical protein